VYPSGQEPFSNTLSTKPPDYNLTYERLRAVLEKAYRNGNWRRLSFFEKALYRGVMGLARLRGRIINPSLVEKVRTIISKLVQTPVARILHLAGEQASCLLELYGRNGVLQWAPSFKQWLKNPEYLLWLGAKQLTLRSLGYKGLIISVSTPLT